MQELQSAVGDLDAGQVSVDSLTESCVHCREMLQDHFNQLQYLLDLHRKVDEVMSTYGLHVVSHVSHRCGSMQRQT